MHIYVDNVNNSVYNLRDRHLGIRGYQTPLKTGLSRFLHLLNENIIYAVKSL